MLEHLVPGFQEVNESILTIAPSGYILMLNVRYLTPEFYHTTYDPEWVEQYKLRRYTFFDPILLWSTVNTGARRWSEINLLGMKATSTRVMEQAKSYGLTYGAIFVERNTASEGERCILSAGRADREFYDAEVIELGAAFQYLISAVGKHAGISASERSALQGLAEGLNQDEIALRDGVTRDAVKKRIERARRTLGAANTTQAVAIAVMKGLVTLNDVPAYGFASQ
ncbi:autoinducer binding domain-containing protein, partial [Pseudorhodobacter sp.]|uniref:helix-turn-helix transcriptional regulator n=1 Tax=Pseudorhodobacter sp. TaxID=1934400 RepID=UPI002647810F